MEDLGRSGGRLPSGSGAPALPGAFRQRRWPRSPKGIAAQRRSIEALKARLSSYDEQLAVLEQILDPLAEWSRTWADLEQRLLNMDPRPEAGR